MGWRRAWRWPTRGRGCPSCWLSTAIQPADRQWLERIADGCIRYTPMVALDPPDGLILDVTRLRASVRRGGGAGARMSRQRMAALGMTVRHAFAEHVGRRPARSLAHARDESDGDPAAAGGGAGAGAGSDARAAPRRAQDDRRDGGAADGGDRRAVRRRGGDGAAASAGRGERPIVRASIRPRRSSPSAASPSRSRGPNMRWQCWASWPPRRRGSWRSGKAAGGGSRRPSSAATGWCGRWRSRPASRPAIPALVIRLFERADRRPERPDRSRLRLRPHPPGGAADRAAGRRPAQAGGRGGGRGARSRR